MKNLNNTLIPSCEGPDKSLVDFGITKRSVSVYFKDLEYHLIRHIHSADAIFGCVAWMTNHNILDALSSKSVSIVVQKEDFLKPDIGSPYCSPNQRCSFWNFDREDLDAR